MKSTLDISMSSSGPRASRARALAVLLALVAPAAAFAVDGWATQGGGTTGGSGGSTVTVSSLSAFQSAVTGTTPRIIYVSGTIDLGSADFDIGSNKTIIGVGSGSGFKGDLRAKNQSNLILQNLNFTNPSGVGDADGLTLQYTTRYFVTHCTFFQCADGELDQTHACDYGTVSWCKFYYSSDTGHNFVNLIGHSDSNGSEDTGHLRITMHHNWYSTLCKERMPRVRFGKVHVYNNYYGASGSNYNIGVGNSSQILAQNNYFDGQSNPWKNYSTTSSAQGLIHYSGNYYVNCSQPTWAPNSTVFTPPYSYTLDTASNVKSIVTSSSSGAGTH
jgi:pectate lyase